MISVKAIPMPEKTIFWLIIVFLIRICELAILFWLGEYSLSDGLIGNLATDAQDYYINTATNIANTFTYAKHAGQPYAGHMPGYDLALAPLLWLFPESTALNVLWILQWLFGCVATYLLARISYYLFKHFLLFVFVLAGYGINTYVAYYDFFVLTESFAISSLITGIFLYLRGRYIHLILAGAFFTWSCFLRPYLFPVFFLFGLGLLWRYRNNLKTAFINATIFAGIFIIAESLWITRNYLQFNRFVPLIIQEQLISRGRMSAIRDFIRTIGGDDIFWNPAAEILVFYDSRTDAKVAAYYREPEDLPAYMFTRVYNADSLRILRNWYRLAEGNNSKNREIDSIVVVTAERYKQAFIAEKPFFYYIIAPVRLLGKFLLHSGTYNLSPKPFSDLPFIKKLVKVGYSGLYYFTWIGGILGCITLLRYSLMRSTQQILFALTALYPVILFPIVLRSIEYRYFALAYPFLFVMAVWLVIRLFQRSKIWHTLI